MTETPKEIINELLAIVCVIYLIPTTIYAIFEGPLTTIEWIVYFVFFTIACVISYKSRNVTAPEL